MFKTLLTIVLVVLMCGVASADLIYDWPMGERNEIPVNIEGVRYDFEEGSNCKDFDNQFPEVATFPTVLGTFPFGSDWPSYVSVGGRMCGITRCEMKIYPWIGYNPNGTPYDWVYVVNGRSAFSPMTGPDDMGGFWPGTKTQVQFKEGTRYVSFLATTGGTMYVSLYDRHNNRISSERIPATIFRTGTNPSNFTRFSYYSLNTDIVSMKISGIFNGNHLDDLVIGGEPGYLSDLPADYSYAAERLEQLVGLDYLEFGTAWDYMIGDYRTAEEMTDDIPDPYLNLDLGEIEFGIGIDDQDAILWAFNGLGDGHINWWDTNRMHKHDFTEIVEYGDQKPGDVFFIDYPIIHPDGSYGPDGWFDEIGIVIEPMLDTTGDVVDIIRITPTDGVYCTTSEFINAMYGIFGIVEYRSLPDNPKGGHKPYQKIPASKI